MIWEGLIARSAAFAILFLLMLAPSAHAAFTANSPEFKEVVGKLHMDGHSEHELTTCKVRKVYNSEVLDMLNQGKTPDDIISHYTDALGPAALKVPDVEGSGLLAWAMPGVGVLAGGAVVWVAIRRLTAAKTPKPDWPEKAAINEQDFSSFEKALESERKKHF